ncbi:MAG: hypothetical protein JXA44_12790 [Methanospirillaceae archaeon]|nr:hypothetical protein [Methanospirillaceae archaeon]
MSPLIWGMLFIILGFCMQYAALLSPAILNGYADSGERLISPTRYQFLSISSDDILLPGTLQDMNKPVQTVDASIHHTEAEIQNSIKEKKQDGDADSSIRTGFSVSVDQPEKKVRYAEEYQMIGTLFDMKASFAYNG